MARKSHAPIGVAALLIAAMAAMAAVAATAAVLWLAPPSRPGPQFGGPFALTDANDGRTVTERSFRGKLTLIYFGYTYCPDACPTALNNIGDAMAKLGPAADKIAPLFISVDPARDTPKIMANYVKAFDPRIQGLTGDAAAIAQVTREFGVYYKRHDEPGGGYAMDHSSLIYIVDAQGKFLKAVPSSETGNRLAGEIRKLLDGSS
jgi:protein SCO1